MYTIVPFPKVKSKNWSLEQVMINDYGYFHWMKTNFDSGYWLDQITDLHTKANNYVPQISCSQCSETPTIMSVYRGYENYRGSGMGFIDLSTYDEPEEYIPCTSIPTSYLTPEIIDLLDKQRMAVAAARIS